MHILSVLRRGIQIGCAVGLVSTHLFAGAICVEDLKKIREGRGANVTDHWLQAQVEQHRLLELFDAANGLAVSNPADYLNAGQLLYSLALREGVAEISARGPGLGTTFEYKLFSGGGELTDGYRVVGQAPAIEKFMASVKDLALGRRAGRNPVLLDGVPGTGKSEFLKVVKTAYLNATLKLPDFRLYTFGWKNLHEIPSLQRFVKDKADLVIMDPIHDSPFVILPPVFQDYVRGLVREPGQALASMEPLPKSRPSPWSDFYRREILAHYTAQKGTPLTPEEIVERLDHHVTIRRFILGTDETTPRVGSQGSDVDYAGLFGKPHAGISNTLGPTHPLGYLPGRVALGNRGIILLDEFLKNKRDLQQAFLGFFEDRSVAIGGSAELEVDAIILTATNTEDIEKLKQVEQRSPVLDRLRKANMHMPIRIDEIMRTLVYQNPGMKIKALRNPEAPVVRAVEGDHLLNMIPRHDPGDRMVYVDNRYNLWVEDVGGTLVHVAPQALRYMALVTALSRMNFNPESLKAAAKKYPLASALNFTDPVSRLRALTGESDLTGAQLNEFWNLSIEGKEGTFGISARDLARWLATAVHESLKRGRGTCVTPVLLRSVLETLLREEDFMENEPQEARAKVVMFEQLVAQQFILPQLQHSISSAFAGSLDGSSEQIYDILILELLARSQDKTASHYVNPSTNQQVKIKDARMQEILTIYERRFGRKLEVGEIAEFELLNRRARNLASSNGETQPDRRDPNLLQAITEYQAGKLAESHEVTFEQLIQMAAKRNEPGAVVRAEQRSLIESIYTHLEHDHGFCPHCASVTLQLIGDRPVRNNANPKSEGQSE